jgi:hypothetical protein
MPTDKQGNQISWKEFMSSWKKGIEGLTPYQKIKSQIWGTRISLLGIVLGIIASIIAFKNLWWVLVILIGALIVTGTQYLSLVQQRKLFEDIEKQFELPKEEVKEIIIEQQLKGGKENEQSNKDRDITTSS